MSTPAILPITSIPGWPAPLPGVMETLQAATAYEISPDGLHVGDAATAQSVLSSYAGSADELAFNKSAKLVQLSTVYLTKFGAGFNYTGPDQVKRTFQIDATSQFNIDVQANASLGAIINGEAWDQSAYFIAADNSHMATPTPQAMRAFALTVRAYVQGLILNNRALKDTIGAAADMATLNAIDITAGWPANP